jgi:radical SAM family uncharacterized protein/radical SAM-linked protein
MSPLATYKQAFHERVLPFVSKPSRYLSGEWNTLRKDLASVRLKVALAFPDAYEIGMSHLGLKLLYQLLNKVEGIAAERVYAPWTDAEDLMRRHAIPLCSHESGLALSAFDIVGFTLQYELCYPTILHMLALGGVPLRSAARDERHPLVIAGGPCAYNPEPIADFIDAFLIGDGEEAALDICRAWLAWRGSGGGREKLLEAMKAIPGVYVPLIRRAGEVVRKRTALKLDVVDYGKLPVPFMEIVHDRANIEVMRGCTQGCRFCQAGYLYRPLREHGAEAIRGMTRRALEGTGYEEVSLSSLSIADLSCLRDLVPPLMAELVPDKTALSLPSLRVEALNRNQEIADEIGKVRRTGFTIAPEAGSARLRKVINKEGFDEEDILRAARNAARAGWESVKFYFMIGLPTETQHDLDEIVRVARECARIGSKESRRGFGVTVSTSSFVPKPHTPFQWFPQEPMDVLKEKQAHLRGRLREARVEFKWHHVESSFLEGLVSLGGREVAAAVERAEALGCRFDGWTEHLRFDRWMQACAEAGVDPHHVVNRPRNLEEPLPWDHIDCGVSKKFLAREYKKALEVKGTPDCHVGPCSNCGEVCVPDWRTWAEKVGLLTVASHESRVTGHEDAQPVATRPQEVGLLPLSTRDSGPATRDHGRTAGEAAAPVLSLGPMREFDEAFEWRDATLEEAEASGVWNLEAAAGGVEAGAGGGSAASGGDAPAGDGRGEPGPPPGVPAVQRLHITFRKGGELRYLSHLEVVRCLIRAMRRAGLPLAYSGGYSPQPRVSLASALAVGVAGLRELAEVELRERVEPGAFVARLNGQLPEGLLVLGAWEAPLHGGAALGQRVRGAVYALDAQPNGASAQISAEACRAFLAQASIVVEVFKKGKMVSVDVRPFIRAFTPAAPSAGDGPQAGGDPATDDGGPLRWELALHAGPTGSVRPQAIFRRFLETAVPAEAVAGIEATLQVTRTALELDGTP